VRFGKHSTLLKLCPASTYKRTVPKGGGRIEIERESESDVYMVTIWQHVCQKLYLEVKLDDFICVGNDATVAEEVR
jgi:hypothetical protein